MLEADRAALSASVQQGFLAIREKELQLYNSQLNAIGTQSALIAGFSFSGLFAGDTTETEAINYMFFFFAALSLMTALYAVCHATFVSVWAPSLALRGDSPEAVEYAIDTIKKERNTVFISAFMSIIAFALASIFLSWMYMPDGCASIATVILFAGICVTIKVGFDVRDKFNRKKVNQMLATQQRVAPTSTSPTKAPKDPSPKPQLQAQAQLQPARSAPTLTASALAANREREGSVTRRAGKKLALEILHKEDEFKGGTFVMIFLVVEKGFMHIYKSKRDYLEHRDPMNEQPISLAEYRIDADPSRFISRDSGIIASIRKGVTGISERTVIDYLTRSDKDEVLNPQLRFALLPTVEDELKVRSTYIFQPADDNVRQRCLDVMYEYTSAEEAKPTVDTFIHSMHTT